MAGSSWDVVQRNVRILESTIDSKLTAYSQLPSAIARSTSSYGNATALDFSTGRASTSSSQQNIDHTKAEAELTSLLAQLSHSISELTSVLDDPSTPPTSGQLHAVQRHREVLLDLERDFRRASTNVRHAIDRRDLLGNVQGDIHAYKLRTAPEADQLLAERGHIDNSHRMIDSTLQQAYATRADLASQHSLIQSATAKIRATTAQIPALNRLITMIGRRRRRDQIIIAGITVISRQFRDMPRSRVEGLLSSFPKLLPANSQHTTIETESVRYVYQPLEDLYMILITNRSSNILQDIDTLHLFARTVSDLCRSLDERDIVRNSFELLEAFDEIVSLGYRENVSLIQIRSILEMDSHEEKIQEIIERNKELEAKEELKRRAKQLELQRREAARRGMGPPGGGFGSGMGMGGGSGGYSSVPGSSFEPAAAPVYVHRENSAASPSAPSAKPFKGKGMQLGKKAKGDLLGSIDG
ncbi:coatomer subunit delta [Tilletia horrida]|uniref:Coatomer subunit delta n=1 Tax=Tilletia horrida TaxID=155126 RepID=A0AAN6JPG8_9BASI|nr:coatomer subunit delta [Tilletia horrida]KAK0543753.1 coatomer subunit delta [Tilletia horrida]